MSAKGEVEGGGTSGPSNVPTSTAQIPCGSGGPGPHASRPNYSPHRGRRVQKPKESITWSRLEAESEREKQHPNPSPPLSSRTRASAPPPGAPPPPHPPRAMAETPERRRYSGSPSPYRGNPKSRSRSRSPAARSQSRSPVPDPRSQARSRSRSREREPDAVNHGNTLYVTGLSSRVTERELKDYFSKEGRVTSCHVVLEPHTRVSRGFAFVTMDTVEDAERCIKYLNQSVMEGRNITVEKSRRGRPRTPTPGSYLGHRYDRREPRGRYRSRGGGYGRDEYYGNSYRRSPPPMYPSYRDTRDYPPYRDTRDYSPHRDARDYYDGRGGRGYSPHRSPPYGGGRARRERSRSLPYSPYRMPERGYGRRAGGGGYDR
uniref:RRM domain-containing protein n=2 Tax=Oryza TaxID=4527 RepID=A0A0E0E6I2_9ORYZ